MLARALGRSAREWPWPVGVHAAGRKAAHGLVARRRGVPGTTGGWGKADLRTVIMRLYRLLRWVRQSRIRILAYHGVDERDDPVINFDGLQVTPAVFEEHLRIIRRDYHPLTLRQVTAALYGEVPPPSRAVVLTFDDGYLNNYSIAAPLLEKYGIPATFFLTTGFIGSSQDMWWYRVRRAVAWAVGEIPSPDGRKGMKLSGVRERVAAVRVWEDSLRRMPFIAREQRVERLVKECGTEPGGGLLYPPMSWDQVRDLARRGFEIGAHTIHHVWLGAESGEVVREEIGCSIKSVRREIAGVKADAFSLPYGADAMDIQSLLEECGVRAAVTTRHGLAHVHGDPWRLPRLNIGRHEGTAFMMLLAGMV